MSSEAVRREWAAAQADQGSALLFLLLKFQAKANDPTSQYFLPLLLSQISNPIIYPVLTADKWDFGLTGDDGTQIAQNICADTAAFGQVQIPSSATAFPAVTLGRSQSQPTGKVEVAGLFNASLGTPVVSGPDQDQVTVAIQFGVWTKDQVPATLQPNWVTSGNAMAISGTFEIIQSCCVADLTNQCIAGTQSAEVGWGTFVMAIGGKTSGGAFNVTGNVNATVTVVSMNPPQVGLSVHTISLAVADLTQLTTTVDVSSIPIDKHRAEWNDQANKALNDSSTKNNVVANVNAVLSSPDNLTTIQTLLEKQVNDYLQSLFQEA